MSDHFSGHHHKQSWVCQCSDQNVITHLPFAFKGPSYYSDHSAINNSGEDFLHHRLQPNNNFAKPPPTTNLRIGTWGRGGAKAYFRFHGGIGDGCGGVACRNTEENAVARPLQLFEALDPINFQIDILKKTVEGGFAKNPVIGPPVPPAEASGGTGVFLPVYPKRIRAVKGMRVTGGRDGGWQQRCGGRMKQEDIFSKSFVGGDVVEEEECKDIDEIPIEQLLPPEWTY